MTKKIFQDPALSYKILFLIIITSVGLIFRINYVLNIGGYQLAGDDGGYYEDMLNTRNYVCEIMPWCSPLEDSPLTIRDMSNLIVGRNGIMPIIYGTLMTVFPSDPETGFILNAILDVVVGWMVFSMIRRMGFPFWVSLAGLMLWLVYIPTVIENQTLLQQNFIRFALIGCLWAYLHTVYAEQKVGAWVILGSSFAILLGFSTQTNRPMLWMIWAVVLLIAWFQPRQTAFFRWQFGVSAIFLLVISTITLILALQSDFPWMSRVGITYVGLELSSPDQGEEAVVTPVTTPLSCEHYWCVDDYKKLHLKETRGLFSDFAHDPLNFVWRWLFFIYGNMVYPSLVIFGEYFLTLRGQFVQHSLYLVGTGLGFTWLMGRWQNPQRAILALFLPVLYFPLVVGLISVEPRRLTPITPLLAFGLAFGLYALLQLAKQSSRQWWLGLGLFLVAGLMWTSSIAVLSWAIPQPETAYTVLLFLRLLSFLALMRWFMRAFQPSRWSLVPVSFTILIFLAGQSQQEEWRAWSAPLNTPVRQTIQEFSLQSGRQPWILVDVSSASEAASLEIRLNGEVLKTAGEAMLEWSAGMPAIHASYQNYDAFLDTRATRATWWAIPVPSERVQADPLIIEVIPAKTAVHLGGDYQTIADEYLGPALQPYYDGRSIWLWNWNAKDPRIIYRQPLNGLYHSEHWDGGAWVTGDLSDRWGQQTGRYRVYLVEEVFGGNTNALPSREDFTLDGIDIPCGELARQISFSETDAPYNCYEPAGDIAFFTQTGKPLGVSSILNYRLNAPRGDQIDKLSNENGVVTVYQTLRNLFVAQIVVEGEQPYWLLFRLGLDVIDQPLIGE